jgi:CDGSH-type Zn-finger protein
MEKLPKIAGRKSCPMDMEPGTYWWCSCGLSQKQPFCDGSHKGTDFSPVKVEVPEAKRIGWCLCKHSEEGHICDGTHKSLPES